MRLLLHNHHYYGTIHPQRIVLLQAITVHILNLTKLLGLFGPGFGFKLFFGLDRVWDRTGGPVFKSDTASRMKDS